MSEEEIIAELTRISQILISTPDITQYNTLVALNNDRYEELTELINNLRSAVQELQGLYVNLNSTFQEHRADTDAHS